VKTDPGGRDSFSPPARYPWFTCSSAYSLDSLSLKPLPPPPLVSTLLKPSPHCCPAAPLSLFQAFKLVHDPHTTPDYPPHPRTTNQSVPQSVHHALTTLANTPTGTITAMYNQHQQPAGSFLFTGAPPDSSFQSFTQTFAAPPMGGYIYELPTPPSSPPVILRPQGGVRLSTVPLPPEQYPITIDAALTGARAYLLGVDLDRPLPLPLLSSPLLSAPATSPQITEIRIVHDSLYSQPIFIAAAPGVGYIRIYDVILAIHRAMAPTLGSLPGTKFVGLAYDVARSNRLLRTQDKYQDRTWILMTHDQFVPVSH
jgi:hypothetical protein